MKYCRVIVEGAPFVNEEGFTYHVPAFLESYIQIGSLVYVPFGRSNAIKKGIVVTEEEEQENFTYKSIVMIHHLHPVISIDMLELCRYVSDYYACAMIYAIKLGVPKYVFHHPFIAFKDISCDKIQHVSLKKMKKQAALCEEGCLSIIPYDPCEESVSKYYTISIDKSNEMYKQQFKRAPKQKEIFQYIAEHPYVSDRELKEHFQRLGDALKSLIAKGLVLETELADDLKSEQTSYINLTLTTQQEEIISSLKGEIESGNYSKSLINGVTGSGKTLIYEKIIEEVLAKGKQALYLVPEIALSQHLFERLKTRFADRIALLHSQLTERERYIIWKNVQEQKIQIVIGPRSALFLPFDKLGLIIIDEEHESSYKQSEPDPRYHAITVAEFLARRNQALLVLGSATPSVDTLYEVVNKRCQIFNLPERIGQAVLPSIQLVDMIDERKKGRLSLLSQPLVSEMRRSLSAGEQIILLINKKGYSSSVACHECGEVMRCPRCDIPLTYYQSSGELKCNYCEYHIPVVTRCPVCGSDFIEMHGSGTESLESECKRRFPDAVVARLDAQVLEDKERRELILKEYASHKIDILVGTQLLAKGLDFKNTTCIGVINADLTLNLPDFRSAERCFQLMVQVAGRAGRDSKESHVFIQTFQKDHYAFQDACEQNVHQFFLDEIRFRKLWLYPPIVHLCRIIVSDYKLKDIESSMQSIYNYITALPKRKEVIGPSFAPMAKKNNRFRMHLIIKALNIEDIHWMMKMLRRDMRSLRLRPATRILIDVDPENIF